VYILYRPEIENPSAIIVDGLRSHCDKTSFDKVWEMGSQLVVLPAHCTSVLQPLDVGVMGPFKAKLRGLWLADPVVYTTAREKRLACIKRSIAAWESISMETIKSAFVKAIPQPVVAE